MGLSEHEAFSAMTLFLDRFYARAGNDFETLLSDTQIESDGGTHDPAAWEDWMACVRAIKGLGDPGSWIVKPDLITWLETWFARQCNGEWEHGEGIKVESLDNPGWSISIQVPDGMTRTRPAKRHRPPSSPG